MTPSPELQMLTLNLLDAIRIASTPGTKAPIYRPATRDAVRFARQAFRAVEAMKWREQLAASVAATAKPVRWDEQPRRNYTAGPYWTGD